MFLVADLHHTNAPIDVGEFQRQHFLAAKAGVRGKNDELGPIGEMIRMLVPFVFRSGHELFQLILCEVVGSNIAIVMQRFTRRPGDTSTYPQISALCSMWFSAARSRLTVAFAVVVPLI